MKKNVMFLFFAIILIGCKVKEEVVTPLPNNVGKSKLDTLWRARLGFSINPILNDNKDIFVSHMFGQNGDEFKLFDHLNGKLKWKWNDFLVFEEGLLNLQCLHKNELFLIASGPRRYALNINTGQTVWRSQIDSLHGESRIYENGDKIYSTYISRNKVPRIYIYHANYSLGDWNPLCYYEDSSSEFQEVNSAALSFSKNSQGETILVITLHVFSADVKKLKVKVCGYNMVKKQFEWVKDYTSRYSEFMTCKMVSNDSKVFTYAVYGTIRYLVAINANDGSIAWEQPMPDLGVGIYPYQDKLISLSNGSQPAICVDQNTGNVVWKQNFTSSELDNLNFKLADSKVFKNYLFSTHCDYLLILNLDDGNIVYNKYVAFPNGCLQYSVAINEEKRLFYVQDRNFLNCYKLPDEVKY
ncbi:MAG: PQQ-binding-like beta-propeller repeat protein [bacterium]|nr:PQQ-binding-like beta-propeller repeat protein [bacterium]